MRTLRGEEGRGSCPTCGQAPDEREVDPDRQARRRTAASALEELERGHPVAPVAPGPEPLAFFDRLSDLPGSFLESLVDAAGDPHHADRLMAAVKALLEAQGEAAAAPRQEGAIGAAVSAILVAAAIALPLRSNEHFVWTRRTRAWLG